MSLIKPMNTQYTLEELLCLKQLNDFPIGDIDINREIITWAEKQVLSGSESETLLIIASLGLDPVIDENELEQYINRYLSENNLPKPNLKFAELIWLKLYLKSITESKDRLHIARNLKHCMFYPWFNAQYSISTKICFYISSCAEYLYDEYYGTCDVYGKRISNEKTMTDGEFFNYVQNAFYPYYKLLNNNELIRFLSGS